MDRVRAGRLSVTAMLRVTRQIGPGGRVCGCSGKAISRAFPDRSKRRANRRDSPSAVTASYRTPAPSRKAERDQFQCRNPSSRGSEPQLESRYASPLQFKFGASNANSARAAGAIGCQKCLLLTSSAYARSVVAGTVRRIVPFTRRGSGTVHSLMSMTRSFPSQFRRLGPIVRLFSDRESDWRPRSVIVQRFTPFP